MYPSGSCHHFVGSRLQSSLLRAPDNYRIDTVQPRPVLDDARLLSAHAQCRSYHTGVDMHTTFLLGYVGGHTFVLKVSAVFKL